MPTEPFPVLALTGTVGVGKTAVLVAIHDLLSDARVPHACVERDALAYSWPPRGYFNEEIAFGNLGAVVTNFRRAGATRLVVAGVLERAVDIAGYKDAMPGAQLTICRLTAPQSVREARLRAREHGAGLEWHLHRTIELQAILEAAGYEDYVVENGDRQLLEVAREVLARAGWLG